MTIYAIDPGPIESGWCILDDDGIRAGKDRNDTIAWRLMYIASSVLAIEKIASYGMPVGAEVFETCYWSGRFCQSSKAQTALRPTRKEIVVHLCGSVRAKDSNVRQALIDRWGPPGTKKNPGPTFGISGDMWAALAVATYAKDKLEGNV